jgi:heme-degrading monooxygenase HmoA
MFVKTPKPPYYTVIFTSIRTQVDDGYTELNDELYAEAMKLEGYYGAETLRDEHGYGVAVLYWRSMEDIQQWSKYQKHLYAKKLGKEKWYEGWKVRIAKVEREYGSV